MYFRSYDNDNDLNNELIGDLCAVSETIKFDFYFSNGDELFSDMIDFQHSFDMTGNCFEICIPVLSIDVINIICLMSKNLRSVFIENHHIISIADIKQILNSNKTIEKIVFKNCTNINEVGITELKEWLTTKDRHMEFVIRVV
jgi:hypothetical protein